MPERHYVAFLLSVSDLCWEMGKVVADSVQWHNSRECDRTIGNDMGNDKSGVIMQSWYRIPLQEGQRNEPSSLSIISSC